MEKVKYIVMLWWTYYHDHPGALPNGSTAGKGCHYKHDTSYGNEQCCWRVKPVFQEGVKIVVHSFDGGANTNN